MKKLDKNKGFIADMSLLLVAIVWGGGFVATKGALDNMPPFFITAVRFIIATVFLCIIFWKRIKHITKKDIKMGSIVGLFVYGGFVTQTIGLQYTTPGKQAFLTATYVVIVPFLAWIINKKTPDIYCLSSAILALIGIGFLSIQQGFNIGVGDSLTLLCALLFAFHIFVVSIYSKNTDPIILTIVQLAVCAILSTVSSLILETIPKGVGTQSILSVIYLGVFSTMLGFVVQNVAQKYTSESHASIILSMESLFGCLLSVIILKESFTFKMALGSILIFIAVIISETKLGFLKVKDKEKEEVLDKC